MNALNEKFLSGENSDVLRLITAGSVDDGKSTLIGRLLYDSKAVFADQLSALSRAKHKRVAEGEVDLAMLTDGLEAEREQGITIDVAYRYFATPRRKFIMADAPGHEQYTRNMVTGASTADVAIVLIDATRVTDGKLLTQTRRHSTIAKLLGLRHIIVAVNKMDLVEWDQSAFDRIHASYRELADQLGIASFHILPISALNGDNVVFPSAHSPWYAGPLLLPLLESLDVQDLSHTAPFRFPVQWVARHDGSATKAFRGYAGRVTSGEVRLGDTLQVLPSSSEAVVAEIRLGDEARAYARAGDSVTLVLDRDVDASRGDVLSSLAQAATVSRDFTADLCWLDSEPLNMSRRYVLKHGTRLTQAKIAAVIDKRDVNDLRRKAVEADTLAMNDVGGIHFTTRDALAFDRYQDVAAGGAFILIDPVTHQTAAAGMLR